MNKIISIIVCFLAILILCMSYFILNKSYQHEVQQSERIDDLESAIKYKANLNDIVLEPEYYNLYRKLESSVNEYLSDHFPLNAYQSIACGQDISLLIVGDSIGAQEWTYNLASRISDNYGIKCKINNISMGGNTSYAGYVREMILPESDTYDLAVICYGQNDETVDFSVHYESIIRCLLLKNPNCKIISVLESSQREYSQKMQDILTLASHYGIPVADTIAAFSQSGYSYEDLTLDGIHPDEQGQTYYLDEVFNIIRNEADQCYQQKVDYCVNALTEEVDSKAIWSTSESSFPEPLNPEVIEYDHIRFIPSSEFTQTASDTWEIDLDDIQGHIGIYRRWFKGENTVKLTINNQNLYTATTIWDLNFSLPDIAEVAEVTDCVTGHITVVMPSSAEADGFIGLIIS